MSHVYTIVFINDLNSWICVFILHALIQFFDDWNQVEQLLQEIKRPFSSAGKNCVVCISRHILNDVDCFIKRNATFCQETNHLWNDHRWVCIVNLDNSIVSQVMKIATFSIASSIINCAPFDTIKYCWKIRSNSPCLLLSSG